MFSKKILSSLPSSIRTLRRLSACSLNEGLTFQQFRVLNQAAEGLGQTQISQNLQISTAAISKMVDSLVQKELLVKEEGSDRRSLRLKLTPEGKRMRKLVTDHVEKALNKSFKKLTDKEKSDLVKGLDVLDKLMGYVNEN